MTIMTLNNSACALIIGIDDYTAFDATGESNLEGSANDASAVARLCVALKMGPEDIHVVCSDVRADSPDQLQAKITHSKDTTQNGIVAELGWLKTQLDAGHKGLLWYSGHGDHNDKGLLLCPSDTKGDRSNAIPFSSLREQLGDRAPENLVVVLDCCHGGAVTDHLGRRSTTLGGDPILKDIADEMEIGAVVLTACAPEEQAQQSRFASHWHGAFTWALLSVIDQWQKVQHAGETNVHSTINYRELVKKATVLLDALEFGATPQIYPRAAGGLAVLQRGYEAEATAEQPDAERGNIQLDPSNKGYCLYQLSEVPAAGTPSPFAFVLAVNQTRTINGIKYVAGNEYWSVARDPSSSMTIKIESLTPGGADWAPLEAFMNGNPFKGTPCDASWNASTPNATPAWYDQTNGLVGLQWSNGRPVWWNKSATPPRRIVTSSAVISLASNNSSLPGSWSSNQGKSLWWTSQVQVRGASTSDSTWDDGPSLCPFGSTLYMAWRDASTKLSYAYSSDGVMWVWSQTTFTTYNTASLCILNSTLYMAWKGQLDTNIYYATHAIANWNPQSQASTFITTEDPSLYVFNSKLYMAWTNAGNYDLINYATFDDATSAWSQQTQTLLKSKYGPALCEFNSVLYMVWVDLDSNIYYATLGANGAWSQRTQASTFTGVYSPSLCVFNTKLYMAWKGKDDSNIYYASFNGTTWTPQVLSSASDTLNGPSLCLFNNALYMAWIDKASSGVFCSTATVG